MFRDMFDEVRRLQREINRSFGDFWEGDNFKSFSGNSEQRRGNSNMRNPFTDVEETEKEVIVRFEIPGFDKNDIQLNISSDMLEVRVEKKQESKEDKKGIYKEERSYRGFYKSMYLPMEVIPEKAKAKYKDGVLEVVIPKAEAKKKNRIQIE